MLTAITNWLQSRLADSTKPTICLDFDGVLHAYTTSWKGAICIPDPIVPGAAEFLLHATTHFEVCIHSSRSAHWGGRTAMRRWLKRELAVAADDPKIEKGLWDFIAMDLSIEGAIDYFVDHVLRWPLAKPTAIAYIDDRAWRFEGVFPKVRELLEFVPWNKRAGVTGG